MANNFQSIIDGAIPGFSGLTSSASNLINDLLNSNPSTAKARNKSAYFGVGTGMPNSGVSNAFGYDLYNNESKQQKQMGFDNLLKMLTSYSGTVAPTVAQQMQGDQFNRSMEERRVNDFKDRADTERNQILANRPKKFGFSMTGNRGSAPGGFSNREWWA